MTGRFAGWKSVAERLGAYAERQKALAAERGEEAARLNVGQRASLAAIASRITRNGVLIADEVGMGKTRIAVELARAVIESGGRVAILVPPGLGYQWHDELSDGAIDAPRIMRSLWAYLKAWENPSPEDQKPWFREDAVIVSHAFTNWRLGENADPWRWALVPEVYGRWRDRTTGQLPWGYHKSEMLTDPWVRNAGMSIVSTVSQDAGHPGRRYLGQLLREVEWPDALDPARYFRYGKLREWLERVVGLGLGPFDLVVTDEAHKARASDSGLSRLLQNVIVQSEEARRFALTATPVELDVSQWQSTLGRVGLDEAALGAIQETTNQYADAVQRLRIGWRGSQEAREAYRRAATRFQKALSPYLIRRDKREDPFVRRFHQLSGLPINGYREECEIVIDTMGLSPAWQQASGCGLRSVTGMGLPLYSISSNETKSWTVSRSSRTSATKLVRNNIQSSSQRQAIQSGSNGRNGGWRLSLKHLPKGTTLYTNIPPYGPP